MSSRPIINAMLICDKVITEERTRKKSLIGIFEKIGSSRFPFTHLSMAVYIKLTNGRGEYNFKLELYDLKKDRVLGYNKIPHPIEIEDPLRTYELVFTLNRIKFEHPGKYEFRIYSDEEVFGQKAFTVEEQHKKKPR